MLKKDREYDITPIGYLDINHVLNQLSTLNIVDEKLNFLSSLKEEFGKEYGKINDSINQEDKDRFYKKYPVMEEIVLNKVVSPLQIPQSIYEEHFKNDINDPEFTFWFLKYNAKFYFESLKEDLSRGFDSAIGQELIKSNLNKLKNYEERVNHLLHENKISQNDIFEDRENLIYFEEIEFLRVKVGYYTKHPYHPIDSLEITVQLYANHIFYKEYLKKKLNELTISSRKPGRPNRTDIAYFIYYLDETKTKYLSAVVPSEAAWKELSSIFGKDWKNIHVMYNKIAHSTNTRISKSKRKNIEYVVNKMLCKYPKALDMAKDELNQARLK